MMANRTVDEIRVDLAANRAKLADATAEAVEAVKPANLAKEGVDQVKSFAKTEFYAATSQLKDDEGSWRTDRLLIIGGAIVGAIVFFATVNTIASRRSIDARGRRALEK